MPNRATVEDVLKAVNAPWHNRRVYDAYGRVLMRLSAGETHFFEPYLWLTLRLTDSTEDPRKPVITDIAKFISAREGAVNPPLASLEFDRNAPFGVVREVMQRLAALGSPDAKFTNSGLFRFEGEVPE